MIETQVPPFHIEVIYRLPNKGYLTEMGTFQVKSLYSDTVGLATSSTSHASPPH